MRHFFVGLFLILFVSTFSACRGGLCSAQTQGLDDVDSDCTEDETDNCVIVYNPQQFDGDDDGVGAECDADDADEGVASISAEVLADISADSTALTNAPDFTGDYLLSSTGCAVADAVLNIVADGAVLTVNGDVSGAYSAHLVQIPDGQIIFETTFIDGSTQYGVMQSAGELELINSSGAAVCLSYYVLAAEIF